MNRLLPITAIATLLTIVCALALDEPFARYIATHETYPKVGNEIIHYLEYPPGIEP